MTARDSIRVSHEAHVSGHAGCQWYEVLLAAYPVFPAVVLVDKARSVVGGAADSVGVMLFAELLLLVCPVVGALTVLEQHLPALAAVLTVAAVAAAAVAPSGNLQREPPPVRSSSSLTLVRGFLSLNTAVAILAVDFHVFPRRFAKTESFGFSVMDIGAAAFLLINALVDVRPNNNFRYWHLVQRCCVLLVLGCLRLVSLGATDYQQHASEYGTHCNFFFVLAVVKFVCVPVCRVSPLPVLCAACVTMTYLQHLAVCRLQHWVLDEGTQRADLLSANRESVAALLGHMTLYCWGAAVGRGAVFPATGGGAPHAPQRVVLVCALPAAVAAGLLYWGAGDLPSRRLVNVPFILWMVLLLLLFLIGGSCVELCLRHRRQPLVLQAVNKHQLGFFLVSNLLTGAVNITVDTLVITAPYDTLIVMSYTVVLCVAFVWYSQDTIKIKTCKLT